MRPGDVAALAVVAAALAADIWLIRRGHDTVSTCLRSSPLWPLLKLHIDHSWPPDGWDRGRIERWSCGTPG